jgi:DNA adenine methylase
MSYFGNKRKEVEIIYKNLKLENIETIVEPYCGSAAISYYIYLQNPNYKFILNDNNKFLKQMYNLIKNNEKCLEFNEEYKTKCEYFKNNKEKYLEVISKDTLMAWFIKNKVYRIRPGMFPNEGYRNYKEEIDIRTFPICDFFKNGNIEFYDLDAITIYEKYKNNDKCLILLDPPYISSCNDFYVNSSMNVYEYLYKNDIIKEKAKIYLFLENIWIINLLFNVKNNKFIVYDKAYELSKRKTEHIIISNIS